MEIKNNELQKQLLDCLLKNGMITTLDHYKADLPHIELFNRILEDYNEIIEDKKNKTTLLHIENVVLNMNRILFDLKDFLDLNNIKDSKYTLLLENIVDELKEDDKCFLLYTALYHDIGKSIIMPKHGSHGASIIKNSGKHEREQFSKLGFNRNDFYLMSDLVRFHDYLAMVGTGEVSYLIFAEVLNPVSNISLSSPKCSKKFIDFLLLLNLADMAESMGKVTFEDFTVLMHDYMNINDIHTRMSMREGFQYRKYANVLSELRILSEDHTHERLRRLLRSGLRDFIKQSTDTDLEEYKSWIVKHEESVYSGLKVPPSDWFSRNYEGGINDIVPVNSSLRGINVKPEFYTKFACICKLDYFLGFIRDLFNTMIKAEVNKGDGGRKTPHDLRRDLSMTLVVLINMLVEQYGDFTSNNTKIGLGFERFKEVYDQDKMLKRLTGVEGQFKEAEAYTELRNMIGLWVITP